MNQRFISVLVFAFVVAGCASLLLYRLTVSHSSAQAAPTTTKALVAAQNLELGAIIKDSDVKDAPWPGALPTNAVLKREDIIGRGVTTTIYDGEPIVENRLAPKGAGGGLAAMIPSGMRAVAVRVNDVVGVAGFVVPGMRVDVLISGNPPGRATRAGQPDAHAAAEYRSAVRRTGFQERQRRQAARRGRSEPAGDAGTGRDAQPGEQPDHHPTGAAESAGHASGQDARHGGGGVVRDQRSQEAPRTGRRFM